MHPELEPRIAAFRTRITNPNDSARQRGLRPAERNGLDSLTRHEGNTSYVKSHSKFRNVDQSCWNANSLTRRTDEECNRA
jgi:hypothetical protein